MVDGRLVATVERKSIPDLISSITGGKLKYAMADLAALPHAAIVVEDRYAAIFKQNRVRPATVADALAELQITWPAIPIVFADTRPLAEEWTYRFLAAAAQHAGDDAHGLDRLADLPEPAPPPAPEPTAAEIRAWARTAGLDIGSGGRIPVEIRKAYRHAHLTASGLRADYRSGGCDDIGSSRQASTRARGNATSSDMRPYPAKSSSSKRST
jgi:hypothetical protein